MALSKRNFFARCSLKILLLSAQVLLLAIQVSAEDRTFTFGATAPLTGDLATYGNLIVKGMELAQEDLEKDGVKIALVFEDTPLAGSGVISALNKLLQTNKVDAIAGNFSNVAMLAMGNVVEKAKIPTLHTSAADPAITDFPRYVLSTNVQIKDEAYHIAEHLYRVEGRRRAGVFTILTNFGEAYRDFFEERFTQLGGEIVSSESFQIQDADYRTQLTKLKSRKPDVIFGACFGAFLGRMTKQAKQLGIAVPVYSVYEAEDESVIQASGGAAEGLRYFVTVSEKNNPTFAAFRTRFKTKYNTEPGTFAANSYDATTLLGKAFAKCHGDRECVVSELYTTKDHQGASGVITIAPDGIAKKAFVLKEIKGGSFVEVN